MDSLGLFRSHPVAIAKSLSLTYCRPVVSCNSLLDMYFGRRNASLMKEFLTLSILVIRFH